MKYQLFSTEIRNFYQVIAKKHLRISREEDLLKSPCLLLIASLRAFSTLWELLPWELIFLA